MARTNTYGHYCPAARTLEIVGEKWALLVVRDLIEEPRRFSDLLSTLGGITPKLLTARLRDLEAAGVVERDEQVGRRDVWYQLTPAGKALLPVLRELVVWGTQYTPGPVADERTSARSAASAAVSMFNARGLFPPRPVTWAISYDERSTRRMTFDGNTWGLVPINEHPPVDLSITTDPATWVNLIRSDRGSVPALPERIALTGAPDAVADFTTMFTGR